CLPLYMKALLLEETANAETLLKSVMMSSVMPSLKYSCSESPLMLLNGSTQIEARAESFSEAGVADVPPDFAASACARAIITPSARRNSCACALAGLSP